MRVWLSLVMALVALPMAGCGDDGSPSTPAGGGGSGGGVGAVLLAPPADGKGTQLSMRTTIKPGVEIERCKFFKLPDHELPVNSQEMKFSKGSHHVLLYSTSYKEIPTKTSDGRTFAPDEVVDCPDGAPAAFEVDRVIGGSQTATGPNIFGTLPPDAALTIKPGAIVLMNAHYLNATDQDLDVEVAMNLNTIPREQVKHEAGVIFFYNPFIRVPAHGKHSARMRCPVPKEIRVFNMQSHMHRRGVGYEARLLDAQGQPVEQLYTTNQWEDVPVQQWADGKVIPAGSWLDYRCDYSNQEDRTVIQGLKTSDEMCMLIGAYYPKDERFEVCEDENGRFPAVWHGNGTADCNATLGCVLSKGKTEEGFYGCVVDACEKVGPQVSDLVRCQFSRGNGACDDACSKGEGCNDCLATACKPELDACSAATCN